MTKFISPLVIILYLILITYRVDGFPSFFGADELKTVSEDEPKTVERNTVTKYLDMISKSLNRLTETAELFVTPTTPDQPTIEYCIQFDGLSEEKCHVHSKKFRSKRSWYNPFSWVENLVEGVLSGIGKLCEIIVEPVFREIIRVLWIVIKELFVVLVMIIPLPLYSCFIAFIIYFLLTNDIVVSGVYTAILAIIILLYFNV